MLRPMSDSSAPDTDPSDAPSPEPEPEASTSEASASESKERAEAAPDSSAVDDLTQGLGLMFRAAKKAVMGLDPQKIETMGREAAARATREVERLDKERVSELGKKAAENLRPEKIEAFAEDAGRELVNVVERVADRVEQVLGVREGKKPSAPPPAHEASSDAADSSNAEPQPRVRVDD